MQNSRLFSRLFSKTITSFSTLKVIRKVIILKDAGTSSWRARLNKIWPKPEKNFTHMALIVAFKKNLYLLFQTFSRSGNLCWTNFNTFSRILRTNPVPFSGYDLVWRQFTVSWILILHKREWSILSCIASLPNLRYAASLFRSATLPNSLFLSKCWEWGKSVIFKTVTGISVEFSL